MKTFRALLMPVAAVAACLGAGSVHADDAAPVANWKTQDLSFRYTGFGTRYSCAGLRDKLQLALLALGARKDDLKLSYSLCGPDSNRPYDVISLKLHLSSLQTASADAATTSPAQWRSVDIGRAAHYERGDCELAEQLRESLLPLFTTRNVRASDGGCVPNGGSSGTPMLKLDVLLPAAG